MAMLRIKKGDSVKVISGAKKGTVVTVQAVDGDKVLLSGIGNRKRHQAANRIAPAGKRDIQLPIHISNVALVIDEKSSSAGQRTSRVGYVVKPNGDKVRVARQAKNKEIHPPKISGKKKG